MSIRRLCGCVSAKDPTNIPVYTAPAMPEDVELPEAEGGTEVR